MGARQDKRRSKEGIQSRGRGQSLGRVLSHPVLKKHGAMKGPLSGDNICLRAASHGGLPRWQPKPPQEPATYLPVPSHDGEFQGRLCGGEITGRGDPPSH